MYSIAKECSSILLYCTSDGAGRGRPRDAAGAQASHLHARIARRASPRCRLHKSARAALQPPAAALSIYTATRDTSPFPIHLPACASSSSAASHRSYLLLHLQSVFPFRLRPPWRHCIARCTFVTPVCPPLRSLTHRHVVRERSSVASGLRCCHGHAIALQHPLIFSLISATSSFIALLLLPLRVVPLAFVCPLLTRAAMANRPSAFFLACARSCSDESNKIFDYSCAALYYSDTHCPSTPVHSQESAHGARSSLRIPTL